MTTDTDAPDAEGRPSPSTFAKRLRAIRGGNEREALASMREHLADQFLTAPVTVAAQLASQLLKVLEREAELAAAEGASDKPQTKLDELKRKREERQASGNATAPNRAAARRRGGPKRRP